MARPLIACHDSADALLYVQSPAVSVHDAIRPLDSLAPGVGLKPCRMPGNSHAQWEIAPLAAGGDALRYFGMQGFSRWEGITSTYALITLQCSEGSTQVEVWRYRKAPRSRDFFRCGGESGNATLEVRVVPVKNKHPAPYILCK